MLEMLRGVAGNGFTVHGFRSAFRDWAGERTNFPRDVIEFALAHKLPDKVEAAYRRETAVEKRRKLMQTWATYCGTPASTATVTRLHVAWIRAACRHRRASQPQVAQRVKSLY